LFKARSGYYLKESKDQRMYQHFKGIPQTYYA
jgi:hypothetical protein